MFRFVNTLTAVIKAKRKDQAERRKVTCSARYDTEVSILPVSFSFRINFARSFLKRESKIIRDYEVPKSQAN